MKFRFQGGIFSPHGCRLRVDPRRAYTGIEDMERLYVVMKERLVRREGFDIVVGGCVGVALAAQGQTAGRLVLSKMEGGTATRVHALAVFLAGLDERDDLAAIAAIRGQSVLRPIAGEDFETLRTKPRPYAAAYFTCQESMDEPFLYDVLKAAYAAFFDRLGMGLKE